MYILYSLLLACAALISMPWLLLRVLFSGKYRTGITERLGMLPDRLPQAETRGSIWIHAVSVGEVLAITSLVTMLRERYPERPVLVSTTTLTAQYLARGRFGENSAFFVPVDFGFAVRPYLRRLRPQLLVLAETEFWPNLLHLMKKHGAGIAVVNARISDRSFPRYRRFRRFFRRVLAPVDVFLAQTDEDARRLTEIGAPAERVKVSGNLKFDMHAGNITEFTSDLGRAIGRNAPVIVCGSTTPGEEELLLQAFQDLAREFPAAIMILAPRHPERFDAVADLVTSLGLTLIRRNSWNRTAPIKPGVFLLDSVGELAAVYSLASIAFVGGSLFPVGGHNILEPAQHGVAVMTGPYTFNFREIIWIFVHGGALKVTSPQHVSQDLLALVRNHGEREELARRAKELFHQNTGATEKTLQALAPLLERAETNH